MSFSNISVIIPVYNSSNTILRALESVITQTLLPKKIILVNDQSTDNSLDVINEFKNTTTSGIEIVIITLEVNSGPSKARNTGWENAVTDYIAFLDSDDSWHPQKLEIQYNFMKSNPNIKLSGHTMDLITSPIDSYGPIDSNKIEIIEVAQEMLIKKNYFTTTSNIMIKNDINLKFDETMRYAEDYYLWLEICFKYNTYLLNYPLGYAYKSFTGVSGLSGNVISMYKGSLLVSKKLLNENKITFFNYIIRTSIRTLKFIFALLKKNIYLPLKG